MSLISEARFHVGFGSIALLLIVSVADVLEVIAANSIVCDDDQMGWTV
jgi:hypothetical protein